MPSRNHPSSRRRRKISKRVQMGALAIAAVVVGSLVTVAFIQADSGKVAATPPAAAPESTGPAPVAEPVKVSVLSDSHAFNADSWWRQTVEAGHINGATMGAFESQPGALASSIIPRLDAASAPGGYVIVQAGTNNLLSAHTPEQAAAEIEALWQGVRDRGAEPVAALVPPSDTKPAAVLALNDLLRDSAAAQGVPVLDLFTAVNAGDGSWGDGLSTDGVHANKAGSDLMASAAGEQIPAILAL